MALRNGAAKGINRFRGHNSTDNLENIAVEFWSDSLNVMVNSKGSAEAMRSPKAFNAAVGTSNHVKSLADYLNPYEHRAIFDINASSGTHVATYKIENDFSNTLLRADQHDVPFMSMVVNQQLYRISPYDFIQICAATPDFASWAVFAIGVDPPAAAPTISYQSGGSGAILVGIQGSYAYMNSRTGAVSKPSPISNLLGASGASKKVRMPVVASVQTGVDKLVFFFTKDDGAQAYLIIDTNGDPVTKTNATTNYDFDLGTLAYDTLTPEPIFNDTAPAGGNFMFQWKDKVFVTGFDGTGDIPTTDFVFSGLESCYIGIPQECYPPLNRVSCASKGEIAAGGIATQLGALLMSDLDSYLLTGFPSDKTSGPEATTAVSEVLTPMNWQVGTKSPKTIRNSPFGTFWLDQTFRVRLWTGQGFPDEVGLPLRKELSKLDKSDFANCVGQWYQFADNGGVYVLTGKIASTGKQQLFLISIYQDPATGQQMTGYAISSVEAFDLAPIWNSGVLTLFTGGVDRIFSILLSEQVGDGWPMGASIFFEMVVGNENNYQYFHSLHFDADVDLSKLTVTVRDVTKDAEGNTVAESINNARTLTPELSDEGDGTAYTLIDEYGRRKVIRFAFTPAEDIDGGSDSDTDDTSPARKIKNVIVVYNNKKRMI